LRNSGEKACNRCSSRRRYSRAAISSFCHEKCPKYSTEKIPDLTYVAVTAALESERTKSASGHRWCVTCVWLSGLPVGGTACFLANLNASRNVMLPLQMVHDICAENKFLTASSRSYLHIQSNILHSYCKSRRYFFTDFRAIRIGTILWVEREVRAKHSGSLQRLVFGDVDA